MYFFVLAPVNIKACHSELMSALVEPRTLTWENPLCHRELTTFMVDRHVYANPLGLSYTHRLLDKAMFPAPGHQACGYAIRVCTPTNAHGCG